MEFFKERITAGILAGGRGRRLGGIDKGWYEIAGRPLIEHTLARLRPQAGQIVISANRSLPRYRALGHAVCADDDAEHLGPLAGIASVLGAANTPYVLIVPVDTPLFPADLGKRLSCALGADADIAVARTPDAAHPLHALMRRCLRDDVRAALRSGVRRVTEWQENTRRIWVDWDNGDEFTNINRAEDARTVDERFRGSITSDGPLRWPIGLHTRIKMTSISRQSSFRARDDDPPLALAEARRRIVAAIRPIADIEHVALDSALHRVLGRPVVAGVDVPSAANSGMDGYGYAAASVDGPASRLKIVGASLAGHPFAGRVASGECVRITTGAVVPVGVDTVVMQENASVRGDTVTVDEPPAPGAHIRPAGEDLARGDTVLGAGHWLRPADIAVLASVGCAEVPVVRRPRVAFFSTGDELRPIDGPLEPGEIYDSNRYGLAAQIESLGMEGVDLGVVGDSRQALVEAFDRAAGCDALVTSGGVSVGSADFVVDVLAEKGAIDFWRVAVKPGKPLAFGTLGSARFFGLPGNPVSTAVSFVQLVRPALVRLAGATPAAPIRMTLPTATDLAKRPGREHFLRARLDFTGPSPRVIAVDHQGSGVMRSMSRADAFIVLPAEWGDVEAGTPVTVEPFAQTVWAPAGN